MVTVAVEAAQSAGRQVLIQSTCITVSPPSWSHDQNVSTLVSDPDHMYLKSNLMHPTYSLTSPCLEIMPKAHAS